MVGRAEHLVTRLDRSIADIRRYVNSLEDPAQRRYAGASAELVALNRDQLRERIALGDDDAIRWALRSVGSMTKGLIDIGSDWQEERPVEWQYLYDTTREAHGIESAARPGGG